MFFYLLNPKNYQPFSFSEANKVPCALADGYIFLCCFFLSFNVRVVSSDHSGLGKSLVVLRLAQEVAALPNNRLVVKTMEEENEEPPLLRVTIPFHDKHAQIADVVGFFLPHALPSDLPLSRIFHLDRSSAVRFSLKRIFPNHN